MFEGEEGLGLGEVRPVLEVNDVRRLVVGQGILVNVQRVADLVEDLGGLEGANLRLQKRKITFVRLKLQTWVK